MTIFKIVLMVIFSLLSLIMALVFISREDPAHRLHDLMGSVFYIAVVIAIKVLWK